MSTDFTGTDSKPGANLLEQFVTLAERLAMGEGGTLTNSNSVTTSVSFLGKTFSVVSDISEKITVTPSA